MSGIRLIDMGGDRPYRGQPHGIYRVDRLRNTPHFTQPGGDNEGKFKTRVLKTDGS